MSGQPGGGCSGFDPFAMFRRQEHDAAVVQVPSALTPTAPTQTAPDNELRHGQIVLMDGEQHVVRETPTGLELVPISATESTEPLTNTTPTTVAASEPVAGSSQEVIEYVMYIFCWVSLYISNTI